jgi:WD repeat-containing protein 55
MELPSEVFAIALHPNRPLLATALLEGHVSWYARTYSIVDDSYKYELGGEIAKQWHTKRHKGSCRGVEFSPDGATIVSIGKDSVIKMADSETGKVVMKDVEAHTLNQFLKSANSREAINTIKYVSENAFVTGDDIGVAKVFPG